MNKWIGMGRLTKDPEVRYGGANNTCVATFNLAVDRRFKREGQPEADFFKCVAFGKTGESVEKYLTKGIKVVIDAEVQNDNYEKNGVKHYGFQFIVNTFEFAESKKSNDEKRKTDANDEKPKTDDFMPIDNNADDDDEIPFA